MAQKTKQEHEEGLLVAAAKTIGKAAGKLAAVSGVKPETGTTPQPKRRSHSGKFEPKNKSRLPRRQKKQAKKQQAANRTHTAAS